MTKDQLREVLQVMLAQQEYIDAIPKDVVLPTMPGFDRDWADEVTHLIKEYTK